MPRIEVPLTTLTRVGTALGAAGTEVTGDATNQHFLVNTETTFIIARNSGGSPRTVTLMLGQTLDGQAPTNRTVSVAAGTSQIIGIFPPNLYNQPTDAGRAWINVDHADLRLQAYRAF